MLSLLGAFSAASILDNSTIESFSKKALEGGATQFTVDVDVLLAKYKNPQTKTSIQGSISLTCSEIQAYRISATQASIDITGNKLCYVQVVGSQNTITYSGDIIMYIAGSQNEVIPKVDLNSLSTPLSFVYGAQNDINPKWSGSASADAKMAFIYVRGLQSEKPSLGSKMSYENPTATSICNIGSYKNVPVAEISNLTQNRFEMLAVKEGAKGPVDIETIIIVVVVIVFILFITSIVLCCCFCPFCLGCWMCCCCCCQCCAPKYAANNNNNTNVVYVNNNNIYGADAV